MAEKIKVEFEVEPGELEELAKALAKWKEVREKELKGIDAGDMVEGQSAIASTVVAVEVMEKVYPKTATAVENISYRRARSKVKS